ncbi:MAG TPA: biotin--[acetyl-CoA-carboxylase] ligase [Candidatus Acidoferrum sp.]|nr:biotin--[acetyl-CoA-carboxylase] ligase [Candidatus Acidoferrum sp.]
MSAIPPDLAPEAIQEHLRSRLIGRVLEVLPEISSTNDRAMAAGHGGAAEGLCVIANRQLAGRGRLGRPWASPSDVGLYTSILLRPKGPVSSLPLLPLVAGLAVTDAIQEVAAQSPRLKWPNDVLLDGRKVAGILTELATSGSSVHYAVVGIGVNVNHGEDDLPPELRAGATSLCQHCGRRIARGMLAAAIYNALEGWYALFCQDRRETILEAGRSRSATLGRPVQVIAGTEEWRGHAVDLEPDGALLVRDLSGALRRVVAGDVSIRTPDEHSAFSTQPSASS